MENEKKVPLSKIMEKIKSNSYVEVEKIISQNVDDYLDIAKEKIESTNEDDILFVVMVLELSDKKLNENIIKKVFSIFENTDNKYIKFYASCALIKHYILLEDEKWNLLKDERKLLKYFLYDFEDETLTEKKDEYLKKFIICRTNVDLQKSFNS